MDYLAAGSDLAVALPVWVTTLAYIGPGPGLGLLAALIGVLVAVGSAVLFIIIWPLRMFIKKRKRRRTAACAAGASSIVSDPSTNAQSLQGRS